MKELIHITSTEMLKQFEKGKPEIIFEPNPVFEDFKYKELIGKIVIDKCNNKKGMILQFGNKNQNYFACVRYFEDIEGNKQNNWQGYSPNEFEIIEQPKKPQTIEEYLYLYDFYKKYNKIDLYI